MSITKKELKTYFKQISFLMPIHRKQERLFLKKLKEEVQDYSNSHPEASYDSLLDHFDEPINVVYNYISSLDQEDLRKSISISKIKRTAVFILIAAIILLFIIRTVFFFDLWVETHNAIVTMEETVIGG